METEHAVLLILKLLSVCDSLAARERARELHVLNLGEGTGPRKTFDSKECYKNFAGFLVLEKNMYVLFDSWD
jgi:hypothetical protein